MADPSRPERELSAIVSFALLRYVQRAVGPNQAEEVRRAAGETRTMDQLIARSEWTSVAITEAIGREAARVAGDVHVGRQAGTELHRYLGDAGIEGHLLGIHGSVEAALDVAMDSASKVSVGRRTKIIDRRPGSILVESQYTLSAAPTGLFCDFSLGYWSSIPRTFGANGYAVELECQARGDARCLTRITWRGGPAAHERGGMKADDVYFRYEELQKMAADLSSAEDVAAVLDLVVSRAGHAVVAPRFLLAVQVREHERLRVHHLGFRSEAAAQRAAKRILSGRHSPSMLVVDVAANGVHYGCIAAVYPSGTEGTETDRRLMNAYAAHAAAALHATAAYEQAQRDRDTAQALLDLSHRLAGATTEPDVSQRLAEAVPNIAGASHGVIYRWDADAERLLLSGCDLATDPTTLPPAIAVGEIEGATELLTAGGPVFLDRTVETGDLLALLESTGVAQAACLPIVARGDLLGLVAACFDAPIGERDRALVIERLAALADQAATSFDNTRLLERARHQATHDGLTGLPNRPMVEELANQALAEARRAPRRVALLFVDLDRFKNVNDTLGHHAGDDLIRQVARRLAGELREVDTVGRIGGDEFVVLLTDVGGELEAVGVADRLIRALDAPFHVAGTEVFISCSVGITVAREADTTYEHLVQQADSAMYDAKRAGANAYAVYRHVVGASPQRRLEIESALHGAVDNGELSVVYQPQVELGSGRIIGAEALARWTHPTLGPVGPDVFIPIAEEAGLIMGIDRWVRLRTFEQMAAWRDAGVPPVRLSFNLSTRELRNPYLATQMAVDLHTAGIDPGLVELEITERVVMADDRALATVLEALHDIGVRLAIDDFGTGSSVLQRLQRHPVDTLKIDRSFIADLKGPSSGSVLQALLQMGARLGIDVLAEGVETEAQRQTLLDLGCSLAQGYLFSRPVPADGLVAQVTVGVLAPA